MNPGSGRSNPIKYSLFAWRQRKIEVSFRRSEAGQAPYKLILLWRVNLQPITNWNAKIVVSATRFLLIRHSSDLVYIETGQEVIPLWALCLVPLAAFSRSWCYSVMMLVHP